MASTAEGPASVLRPPGTVTYNKPEAPVEDQGMTSAEGIKAFDRILSSDMPSGIIVLRGDLPGNPARPIAAALPLTSAAKPEGEVENVLAVWWQELLGVETVGLDDDFFDLGGHSLIAVRMFSKIKKTYQQDLSLSTLFEARTIRQLAALIRAAGTSRVSEVPPPVEANIIGQRLGVNPESKKPANTLAKPWSALVPIQPNGSRTPLFCFHALGPSLLFYRRLSVLLGPDQPFYALQSPLESQQLVVDRSIEELASIYIKELETSFPEGPYVLGGASLGGLIALEVCQQLHARGKKPALLVLFDTAVPGSDQLVAAKEQMFSHWQKLRNQGPVYLLQRFVSKSGYWRFRLNRGVQGAVCSCYELLGRSLPSSLHYFQVEEAHKRALERYVVHPYPGKITLMRAADVEETVGTRRNPTLGWDNLAGGGLAIHDVPGGHISMFEEPNVRILAETLKTILPSSDSEPGKAVAA
jgi:thioesterase domain-containing protein/acyl carrier protein